MTRVFVALGGNIGDRAANLAEARRRLAGLIALDRCSRVYESEPVGLVEQPLFLNQVVSGETSLLPWKLLSAMKDMERAMGRQEAKIRNGPRPIDLDLLFYGDWVFCGDGLAIPHPRYRERSFVLAPLAEIAADWIDPATGEEAGRLWREKAQELARSWLYEG